MKTEAFKTGRNHGGVQCHSVGDIYPNRVVIKGDGKDRFLIDVVNVDGKKICHTLACSRDNMLEVLRLAHHQARCLTMGPIG